VYPEQHQPLFERFNHAQRFHETLASLQRQLVTPSPEHHNSTPSKQQLAAYLERSLMGQAVHQIRTTLLVWEIRTEYEAERGRRSINQVSDS